MEAEQRQNCVKVDGSGLIMVFPRPPYTIFYDDLVKWRTHVSEIRVDVG